jgi:hypothetical protein
MKEKKTGGLVEAAEFFREYVTQPVAIHDVALAGTAHGAMTHVIQDLVVNRALAEAAKRGLKLPRSSAEFRAMLAKLDMVVEFPDRLSGDVIIEMSLGEAVWRGTYDVFQPAYFPTPEAVAPRLQEALAKAKITLILE